MEIVSSKNKDNKRCNLVELVLTASRFNREAPKHDEQPETINKRHKQLKIKK